MTPEPDGRGARLRRTE